VEPASHEPDPLRHLVLARPGQPPMDLGHRLTFRILGPPEKRVRRLHTIWDRELERRGLAIAPEQGQDALEPAAFVDRSVFNLASLIVLAEKDGKSMLLCGDARGDDILEGFTEAGLLGPDGQGTFPLHLMKLPHHGSDRNVTTDFFRQLPADHYLISGDGRHGNPEPSTLRMLREARKPDGRLYRIQMTYGLGELHPKFPVEELRGVLEEIERDNAGSEDSSP
ncbi:MAG: hypothetical protein MI919_18015, partial [Holophagales bacterium]|nr:hypothetical protein [Holophagales bacterium]